MSKTISLETAKQLKAAADQAGITLPETEKYFGGKSNENEYSKTSNRVMKRVKKDLPIEKYSLLEFIPAPDAHELGEWLPGKIHGMFPTITKDQDGTWIADYEFMNASKYAAYLDYHPTIAEALAHLWIACIKADPEQIETHLQSLGKT